MTAWFVGHELVQIARSQVEMVLRSDDPDAQVAQSELPAFLQLERVVEAHRFAAVDERDAARPDNFADAVANHERGVLIDADAEQPGVLCYDEE